MSPLTWLLSACGEGLFAKLTKPLTSLHTAYITLETIQRGLITRNFKDHYGEAVKKQCLDTTVEINEFSDFSF